MSSLFLIKKIKMLWMDIFRPQFSAGQKAEYIFEKQALTNKWIVEKISQDKESFNKYREVANSYVKRGDYICRNCNNIEVEVKCKSLYGKHNEKYYLLEYSHIKRHKAMSTLTNSKIVFAFYERNGSKVFEDTLRMIDLDFLLETSDYKRGKLYDEKNKCIKVPLKFTQPNFKVFDILLKKYPK